MVYYELGFAVIMSHTAQRNKGKEGKMNLMGDKTIAWESNGNLRTPNLYKQYTVERQG